MKRKAEFVMGVSLGMVFVAVVEVGFRMQGLGVYWSGSGGMLDGGEA